MTSPQQLAERALDLGACPPTNYADPRSRRRGVLQTMLRGEQDRARRLQSLIDRASADLADSRIAIAAVEAELRHWTRRPVDLCTARGGDPVAGMPGYVYVNPNWPAGSEPCIERTDDDAEVMTHAG